MQYFSQMVGIPVYDSKGETLGRVKDLGIATGEVFPRITSLAFKGTGAEPFMISWRKYVDSFSDSAVSLKVPAEEIRFSFLQPEEVLVARDLLNRQIVDTHGLKVVRVNDLKLSQSGTNQLRLLGAEVGVRGILRSLSPHLENAVVKVAKLFGTDIPENIIAWSYMDLLDKQLKDVQLSISHRTLEQMHPADIADIIEQLDPRLRSEVFAQLDVAQAADAMAELNEDQAAEIVEDMDASQASRVLSEMNPDDAAELVNELDYEKAEALLRMMGVKEEQAIRQLLGYKEDTAGRIMTSEFLSLSPEKTVADAIAAVKDAEKDEREMTNYLYLVDEHKKLRGVLSLRTLLIKNDNEKLSSIMEKELISCNPDTDQEDVADAISKYNLLALPVVQEDGKLLGIVTVDDALDVLEEEHEEDLQLAGAPSTNDKDNGAGSHELRRLMTNQMWFFFWAAGALVMVLIGLGALASSGVPLGEVAALSNAGAIAGIAFLAGGWSGVLAMPIALLMSDSMINYTTNFFIEHDADDEDKPSMLSFIAHGVGPAFIYMLLMVLIVLGLLLFMANSGIFPIHVPVLFAGFLAAAVTVLISYLTSPLYLNVLYKRDERGKDTSRLTMRFISDLFSLVLFVGVTYLFCYLAFAIGLVA